MAPRTLPVVGPFAADDPPSGGICRLGRRLGHDVAGRGVRGRGPDGHHGLRRGRVADPALELVAAVDPFHAGLDLRQVRGVDRSWQIAKGPEAFLEAGADVVVDFTHLEAARVNLLWLAENGIHAVMGTTGFSDADYAAFTAAFTGATV